jgi:hypothetical protein
MKSSWAISRVRMGLMSTLIMKAETFSKTFDYNAILTRLIAREDFIAFSHRESFKSYRLTVYASMTETFVKVF